ncbi:hypothetical protein BJ165DRAFT_1528060 [Panaeolus papilionaceus]|nr:hypothetical protein BJ165DRAFT_1528060 [Panaeolus papilionaceus]
MASNDSPDLLWYQQAANASSVIGAMAYGIHVAVIYNCAISLYQNRDRGVLKWAPYVAALFALGTANIACSVHYNQLAFIDQRNYPGGPGAFLSDQQGNPSNVGAVATSIMMMIFADIFMIHRVQTLWKRTYITIVLGVVLLASVVMSAFHAMELTKPDGFLSSKSISFSVPYVSLATILNILITVVLVPRLLELRRQVSLFVSDSKEKYTSLEALIVECALPSGLFSLIFIALYGLQKVSSLLFLPLLVQVMGIMPSLIIMRMARGHAWSNEVVRRMRPASSLPSRGGSNPPGVNLGDINLSFGGNQGSDMNKTSHNTGYV